MTRKDLHLWYINNIGLERAPGRDDVPDSVTGGLVRGCLSLRRQPQAFVNCAVAVLSLYFGTNIGHDVGANRPIEMAWTELELRPPSAPRHYSRVQCHGLTIISTMGP